MSITEANKKANPQIWKEYKLQRVLNIHNLAHFGAISIEMLIDSDSKINAMQPSFEKSLGVRICRSNISAQKIDSSRLRIDGMIIALFQIDDKDINFSFFEKTFLLIDMSREVALRILFPILSNVEVNFNNRELK